MLNDKTVEIKGDIKIEVEHFTINDYYIRKIITDSLITNGFDIIVKRTHVPGHIGQPTEEVTVYKKEA